MDHQQKQIMKLKKGFIKEQWSICEDQKLKKQTIQRFSTDVRLSIKTD